MAEHRPDTVTVTFAERDSSYRALVRDVIFGTAAVILLSLAVPAWIIRAEYRKTYQAPVQVTPAAEVLRERISGTVVNPPPAPDILELAERLVREEAEKRAAAQREAAQRAQREAAQREAAQREAAHRAAVQRETARREAERRATAARPAPVIPPVVSTPPFDRGMSIQAP